MTNYPNAFDDSISLPTVTYGGGVQGPTGPTGPTGPAGSGGGSSLTVTNLTALGLITTTSLTDGYFAYVQSQGSYYKLEKNANTAIVASLNIAGTGTDRWARQTYIVNQLACQQLVWHIDGTLGNDENSGLTSLSPLLTFQEVIRRTGGKLGVTPAGTGPQIYINGDMYFNDQLAGTIEPYVEFANGSSTSFWTLNIEGSNTTETSGTIVTYTLSGGAGQLDDLVVTGANFTGKESHIIKFANTTTASGVYAVIVEVLSPTHVLITHPVNIFGNGQTPVNGDPFTVFAPPAVTLGAIKTPGLAMIAIQPGSVFFWIPPDNCYISSCRLTTGSIEGGDFTDIFSCVFDFAFSLLGPSHMEIYNSAFKGALTIQNGLTAFMSFCISYSGIGIDTENGGLNASNSSAFIAGLGLGTSTTHGTAGVTFGHGSYAQFSDALAGTIPTGPILTLQPGAKVMTALTFNPIAIATTGNELNIAGATNFTPNMDAGIPFAASSPCVTFAQWSAAAPSFDKKVQHLGTGTIFSRLY